ncbi:hypothetical protein [Helicobacter pylori]|uniref:Putative n=1 Tax=Helicobacter pylori (strain J99 / ATCC 700824) TaxID=85963 RepID=Q9ZKV6_HELPJ|nr:hypothetical protein [Helicobacter pylori]AAD06406.1 putative [Helicobacter pylori J99]MWR20387.1 hypothetical protein [Helicobacter pylori]MWR35816.1 hypothetical protein [Helicobacter pylori]NPT21595.1 hypothetical protein [Helicobacter pylori]UGW76063.1 hypothetical protein LUA78_01215 [Helicobacter pylori]
MKRHVIAFGLKIEILKKYKRTLQAHDDLRQLEPLGFENTQGSVYLKDQ